MLRYEAAADLAIPDEFRAVAEGIFPPGQPGPGSVDAALAFAEALGVGAEVRRCLDRERGEEQILPSFQRNLDLLIQKTWVRKADEFRKEALQDRTPEFVTRLRRGDYPAALEEFSAILDELAYLFFGEQSAGEDFTEFVFRIDPQIGLFWWYGCRLGEVRARAAQAGQDLLRTMLLLGICYLTNL